MNTSLLNLFSLPSTNPTSVGSALTGTSLSGPQSNGSNIGDLMFSQLLTAQLQSSKASSLGSAANSGLAAYSSQLQSLVQQLMQSGLSLEQIAQQLGGTLGSNFLAQLQLQAGINPNTNMRAALTQMIAQALGPPSNGPPLSAAQAAAAFVQRLTQVADTLTKVAANATGQQQDSLGNISDANAGDTPAPNKTTAGILQAALVALQQFAANGAASASNSTNSTTAQSLSGSQAPVPPPVPWVPTTSSTTTQTQSTAQAQTNVDTSTTSAATLQSIVQNSGGPTVATNPALALIGTGADTVIGRILARAANVAATQSQNDASASTTTTPNATSTLQPQIAVTAASSASNGSTSDALANSVLQTLQNALALLPAPKNDPSWTDPGTASGAPGTAPVGNTLANMPFMPQIVNASGNTPVQPQSGPQSPPPAQPPVDPNAVVDQVLKGISMGSLSDGSQTVRMRLVPESLGSVTVNLQVSNGSVSATLVAQNSDVRDALLANQQMLSRSLADAGLKLSGFTVNLANQGQYQQQQSAYQQQFGTTRRFVGVTSSSADDAVPAVPTYGPPATQLAAMQWLNALA